MIGRHICRCTCQRVLSSRSTLESWRRTKRPFTTPTHHDEVSDSRVQDLGHQFSDEYATIRSNYRTPRHPIVLAHGLLGFAEFRLLNVLPPVQYWHGIAGALRTNGAKVVTPAVPPSDSIAQRAEKLAADIAAAVSPTPAEKPAVNVIAHSMGGLDARWMIAHLCKSQAFRVASLTTIATPHRGSPVADYLLSEADAGALYLPNLYGALRRAGLGTDAFAQLTTGRMAEFNEEAPDDPAVRYVSYGAAVATPAGGGRVLPLLSPFRQSRRLIEQTEGANDGLVSVRSSRWGEYRGTLVGVSHLDLINWSNELRWTVRQWMGMTRSFNAVAFYLELADMLAEEGL